jgi:hypothetical protein
MVPVRAIIEAIGAQVDWDEAKRQVTIRNGESVVKLWIDNPEIDVNGEKHTMDTQPVIKDDRTMVPLRFVGEYLGMNVDWNEAHRLAILTR